MCCLWQRRTGAGAMARPGHHLLLLTLKTSDRGCEAEEEGAREKKGAKKPKRKDTKKSGKKKAQPTLTPATCNAHILISCPVHSL